MMKSVKEILTAILFFLTIGSTATWALPGGANIVRGHVELEKTIPGALHISNSPGAIINWKSFSIGQNELTRFIQQSQDSAVLNRVLGQDPSRIMGQLISNGRVFLINPHGLVVGKDAVIDTAGFVASTLNITDEDFIKGRLAFRDGGEDRPSGIDIRGVIRAGKNGDIYIIAPDIQNSGTIQTKGGNLILAAGRAVTITGPGSGGVHFEVQAPADTALNLGRLLSEEGAVSIFAGTLRHRGEIRAGVVGVDAAGNVVLTAAGDISLEKNSLLSAEGVKGGRITATSREGTTGVEGRVSAVGHEETGGSIQLLGRQVALYGEADIDATGATGGGKVRVGGDFQGSNPDVPNAVSTYVGKGARIRADAVSSGSGGEVIVWSDDSTRFFGTISARGGKAGGDGGFAEVSGKKRLDFDGSVDLTAPVGLTGTLLLDPEEIVVETGDGQAIPDAAEAVSEEKSDSDADATPGVEEHGIPDGDVAELADGDEPITEEAPISDSDPWGEEETVDTPTQLEPTATGDVADTSDPPSASDNLARLRKLLEAIGETRGEGGAGNRCVRAGRNPHCGPYHRRWTECHGPDRIQS